MPSPNVPPQDPTTAFDKRIRDLEAKVEALQKGAPLRNASVGAGGIRLYDGGGLSVEDGGDIAVSGGGGVRVTDGGFVDIQDGGRFRVRHPDDLGGDDAVFAGDIYDQDTGAYLGTGLMVEQPDGTDILMARTDAATGGTVAYTRDRHGRTVFSTDAARGGIGLPWLPFTMSPYQVGSWENTTSMSFATLHDGTVRRQAGRAGVSFGVSCAGGTSGEARVLCNGTQVGSTLSVGAGSSASDYIAFDLPDPLDGTTAYIELQARVASGTGPVYGKVYWAESRN